MEKKKLATLKAYANKYNMLIPEDVCNKIQHVCSIISEIEWSGVLFYTIEGSFAEKNLKVICKDFFVMDVGSVAYTEFDMNPEVISYMTENPELLDCNMGLIHSHNKMATFFSGTDTATLQEEGNDRNHFVSLIVNNVGKYTAAITRKVEFNNTVNAHYSYSTFNNQTIEDVITYDETQTEIQYFYLDIEKNVTDYEDLDKRLDELKKKVKKTNFPTFGYNYSSTSSIDNKKSWPYEKQENKKPVQTSLFNDYGYGYAKYDGWDEDWTTPYSSTISSGADFDTTKSVENSSEVEKIAELILKQLITTSIVCPNSESLDLESWAKNLPGLWEKRFKSKKEAVEAFDEWAEYNLEFLIDHASIPVDGLEDAMISAVATEMVVQLSALETNDYTQTLMTLCENYII